MFILAIWFFRIYVILCEKQGFGIGVQGFQMELESKVKSWDVVESKSSNSLLQKILWVLRHMASFWWNFLINCNFTLFHVSLYDHANEVRWLLRRQTDRLCYILCTFSLTYIITSFVQAGEITSDAEAEQVMEPFMQAFYNHSDGLTQAAAFLCAGSPDARSEYVSIIRTVLFLAKLETRDS